METSAPRKTLVIDFMHPLPENIGRRMRTMNFVRFFPAVWPRGPPLFLQRFEKRRAGEEFAKEYYIRHPSCAGPRERSAQTREAWPEGWTGFVRRRPWMNHRLASGGEEGNIISVVNGGRYDIYSAEHHWRPKPLFLLERTLGGGRP
jgi:hypothetical protein